MEIEKKNKTNKNKERLSSKYKQTNKNQFHTKKILLFFS